MRVAGERSKNLAPRSVAARASPRAARYGSSVAPSRARIAAIALTAASEAMARALTTGALAGLLVGGALGAGLGAAAGISGGVVGTGASVGAIAGGGTGAMLGGSYLYDKGLNDTQRVFYSCLAGRGYIVK